MSFARLRRNGLRCATVLACLAGAYLTTSCGGQSSRLPAIPSSTPAVATANATPTVAPKATLPATATAVPLTSTAVAARTPPTIDEDGLGDLLERAAQELEDEFEGDDALDDLDDALR